VGENFDEDAHQDVLEDESKALRDLEQRLEQAPHLMIPRDCPPCRGSRCRSSVEARDDPFLERKQLSGDRHDNRSETDKRPTQSPRQLAAEGPTAKTMPAGNRI
jgi:hypothetical protein